MAIDIPSKYRGLWESMPWYGKFLTEHFEKIRYGFVAVAAVLGLFFGIFLKLDFFGTSILTLCAAVAYFVLYLGKLEAGGTNSDPKIGLPVVLDVRLARAIKTGWYLGMPFMRVIEFDARKFNRDITVSGVRCRLDPIGSDEETTSGLERVAKALRDSSVSLPESGGEVDFDIGITVEPFAQDGMAWSLLELDQAGELEGAFEILQDALAEDIRQTGRHITWLQAEFSTDLLSAWFIAHITGVYEFDGKHILDEPTDERIREYLHKANSNGFPDAKSLGLKIRRINVTKVTAAGELAKAAEKAAIEKLRRAALKENAKALGEAVDVLAKELGADHGLTKRELIDRIQVDEDGSRVSRQINQFDIPNAEGLAGALFAAVVAMKDAWKNDEGGNNG